MSVPVRNRNLSPIEFIHTFNLLRNQVTDMLVTNVVKVEHQWVQDCWRIEARGILRQLGTEIEIANSIYVTTPEDIHEKVKRINTAIGLCNALKDLLQEIMYRTEKYEGCMLVISELLQKEINLLKGVRRKKYPKIDLNLTTSVD